MDWGLGHATRSMPVIRQLLRQGHQVTLASDGRSRLLLQKEFPDLECLELPGYRIRYDHTGMVWNMVRQLPKITRTAFAEHFAVRRIVRERNIDLIISDNRFGCFHPRVPSYFITHQLSLPIRPWLPRWLGNLANRFWIRRYTECWVPDFEGVPNISGKLSHPAPLSRVRYIGPLTRMEQWRLPPKYELVIVLSGPEPQRSELERILLQQAKGIKGEVLLVQGKTEATERRRIAPNIEVVSFLTTKELNEAICSAHLVVCRSGYSSLMDLSVLGTKALLIPTPGQTEQEYLAQHFHAQRMFMMQTQDQVDLKKALGDWQLFTGMMVDRGGELKLGI